MKKIIAVILVIFSLLLVSCGTTAWAHEDSEYYPLIEKIDDYRVSQQKIDRKNGVKLFFLSLFGGVKYDSSAPEMNADAALGTTVNGSYLESTDNQVAGVLESDLFKMTDKYIFRIGGNVLRVYSVEKENSCEVGRFEIPSFEDDRYNGYFYNCEMYLSADCNTITLISEYRVESGARVGIISIDVSDVTKISERGRVSVDGSLNTTRMVDGKIIVISDYYFNRRELDYGDPETFVPTINRGEGEECVEFDDIIYPDSISSENYSVVSLMDSENLELLGTKALLNFTSDVYISKNNIFITREYLKKDADTQIRMSDIVVMNYSSDNLSESQILTVPGWAEDQYSFDERDGYLRVVTSTSETKTTSNGLTSSASTKLNAALYVIDLQTSEIRAKVENFAPDGEQATAVRFDGDKCYVCTAVVVTFTDPVYFFDLSDYDNITYTDTGIIEGYSDHLINYGEGKLLGIGKDDWMYSKVEIYREADGVVESVDEFVFGGNYSLNYKAYMVNREEDLFGFAVDSYFDADQESYYWETYNCYVLITLTDDGMETRLIKFDRGVSADQVRCAYVDGYLYITTGHDLIVEKIK